MFDRNRLARRRFLLIQTVNSARRVRDKEGKPYSVRYDRVNAMLLNEFLEEYHRVQELESRLAEQEKHIESLAAGLQKVSARVEESRPTPKVGVNNQ